MIDAKNFAASPIARVQIPQRVPGHQSPGRRLIPRAGGLLHTCSLEDRFAE
jgi:hypothetical protein